MIVVDTNIIAYLLIAGERTAQVRKILQRDPQWAAPLLWRSEFRSVLAFYMKQESLSLAEAILIAEEAETLMQGGEYEVKAARTLSLVANSRCSAYDCEFAALAEELGVPLVTSDSRILSGFPSIARSPDAFIS